MIFKTLGQKLTRIDKKAPVQLICAVNSDFINEIVPDHFLQLSSLMARRSLFLPFCWANWALIHRRRQCVFTGIWTYSLRPWRTAGTVSPSPWWSEMVRHETGWFCPELPLFHRGKGLMRNSIY